MTPTKQIAQINAETLREMAEIQAEMETETTTFKINAETLAELERGE